MCIGNVLSEGYFYESMVNLIVAWPQKSHIIIVTHFLPYYKK